MGILSITQPRRVVTTEPTLIPSTNIPRITARVLIEKDGQYLYLLQTEDRGGALSLPGGRVKNKEFMRKGLIREIQEETNLVIEKKALQPVHTLHRKENGEFEVVVFFKAEVSETSNLTLNEPHKFSEFIWIDKNEVPENLISEFRHALKKINKGEIFSEYPKKKKERLNIN